MIAVGPVGTTGSDSVVTRYLDGIKTAAGEAASLTSRLLAFSRRNVPERRLVDVNEIVREAASLLERLVRADVRVKLELAHPLPAVAADLAQLKQVVLNLALILYALYGYVVPGMFHHSGLSWGRIVTAMSVETTTGVGVETGTGDVQRHARPGHVGDDDVDRRPVATGQPGP